MRSDDGREYLRAVCRQEFDANGIGSKSLEKDFSNVHQVMNAGIVEYQRISTSQHALIDRLTNDV